jgi:hypothetical protein
MLASIDGIISGAAIFWMLIVYIYRDVNDPYVACPSSNGQWANLILFMALTVLYLLLTKTGNWSIKEDGIHIIYIIIQLTMLSLSLSGGRKDEEEKLHLGLNTWLWASSTHNQLRSHVNLSYMHPSGSDIFSLSPFFCW